jgi:hypothetical protein
MFGVFVSDGAGLPELVSWRTTDGPAQKIASRYRLRYKLVSVFKIRIIRNA